jgi:hypothetical protein
MASATARFMTFATGSYLKNFKSGAGAPQFCRLKVVNNDEAMR